MTRSIVGAAVVVLCCIGVVLGDEAKGKIKSIDPDKGVVVVTTNGKDETYRASRGTKVFDPEGKELELNDKSLKAGVDVTLTYSKKGKLLALEEIKLNKK